jgi:hypothetical protein
MRSAAPFSSLMFPLTKNMYELILTWSWLSLSQYSGEFRGKKNSGAYA